MISLLKKLFSSEPPVEPLPDLSLIGVDMHSHLIPGIDDGAKTMEETLSFCKQFQELGFRKLITTPHVMAEGYMNTMDIILNGRNAVREALAQAGISIEFDAAAEYYMDENYRELVERESLLTMGDNYVLVEFSYMFPPRNAEEVIYATQSRGYKFLLAHPERYQFFHDKDLKHYRSLRERSVYFQVNLGSLVGWYGEPIRKMAQRLLDEGMVDFVGSDLHKQAHFEHLQKNLSEPYLQRLLKEGNLRNREL